MGEIFVLALAAAFWPILLVVVVIALQAAHPPRLLISFLAGGLLATMTVGLVIVYALEGSSLTDSQSSSYPIFYIVVGALALIAALVLARRYQPPDPNGSEQKSASTQRLTSFLERGAPLAFVAGILLDIFPSPFALIALKDIAELDYAFAKTFLIVLGFYLVMFMFIEVPLVGYLIAPDTTAERTVRFNTWLGRNWHRLANYALAGLGVYLIAKGIYELVT